MVAGPCVGGCGQGGYTGVGTGWVYQGGYTGGTTRAPSDLVKRRHDSGAGPGAALQGRWSGWSCCSAPGASATPPTPDPCRVFRGPLRWVAPRANAASGPITARFNLILLNYSQNHEVSPKYVEKACLSPYIQKPVQKSPLGFLRFPFSLAFSGKELLGHFDPYPEIYVKMTKCRRMCTPPCTRSVRSDTPTVSAASCLWTPLLI